MDSAAQEIQREVSEFIRARVQGLSPEESALIVAVIASQATAELHRLARAEATQRKGTPQWGAWASLQNAARAAVLQASTCRDVAAKLAGHR